MKSRYDYDLIRNFLKGLLDGEQAVEISNLIKKDEIARDIAGGILRLEQEFFNDQNIGAYLDNFLNTQLKIISLH